ncbi:MAG: sigma-70 family RNA polymerase sigma factor [Bryobacteraceae bacterium]|jgi:RNA polymerase sigma factor (TIGR02999 family)
MDKDVTTLLLEWRGGNRAALDELMPLIYAEFRQLASRALSRERPNHTLQSTALAHELYLKLIDQKRAQWGDREHFFAMASQIIRRILVDYARRRHAQRRGGLDTRITLDEALAPQQDRDFNLVVLDNALEALSQIDSQQARIIELRFFGGLSIEATGRILGVSPSTVNREWNLARAWLYRELSRSADASGC